MNNEIIKNNLSELSTQNEFQFPLDFIEKACVFPTAKNKKFSINGVVKKTVVIKYLCNCEKEGKESIYVCNAINFKILEKHYIAIGICEKGQILCYVKKTKKIVLYNPRTACYEYVADNIGNLLSSLY